ncbi:MAG: diacylglycerol/polyprenol kinase family protein [Promethearchaeota archaeon]
MQVSSLAFLSVLLAFDGMFFYLAWRARGDGERVAFKNNLAYAFVLLGSLLFAVGSTFQPVLPYPLDVVVLLFLVLFVPAFLIVARREKRHPHTDAYERPTEGLTFRYELYRKLTHFVVVGIFLVYFYFGPYFMEKFNRAMAVMPWFWGISDFGVPPSSFGQYFAVFWAVISFLGLNVAEFTRILAPEAYPLKKVNRILRDDELHSKMGPHIAMTVGVLSVILTIGPYAPKVACAAISIGIFGDAAANIVGKKFGKHQIRKGKTLEGLLGGAAVSFVSAFGFLMYEELFTLTPTVVGSATIAIIALGGTVTFVLVDFFSPSISDNLLNPLLSGVVMAVLTAIVVL